MFETKERLIEAVYGSIPYANQIKNLEILEDHIRFDWRSAKYKVTLRGTVEEVQVTFLVGSDNSILMEQIIKNYYVNNL